MATQLNVRGAYVKERSPMGVIGLSIITFGIYQLYWYYTLNREMRDLGEYVSPGVSLLAVTLGAWIVVPALVSWYNTGERLKRLQRAAGLQSTTSGAFVITMVLLSFLIVPAFILLYSLQSQANRLYQAAGGGTAALQSGTPPAGQIAAAWPEAAPQRDA